jgi:hypothetical protein
MGVADVKMLSPPVYIRRGSNQVTAAFLYISLCVSWILSEWFLGDICMLLIVASFQNGAGHHPGACWQLWDFQGSFLLRTGLTIGLMSLFG